MFPALKNELRAYRKHRFLAGSGALSEESMAHLNAFTDLELAAASINPDHSAEGREAAAALLGKRGGSPGDARITVPGFLDSQHPDSLERLFFGGPRRLRQWSGVAALVGFVVTLIAVGATEELKTPALRAAVAGGHLPPQEFEDRHRHLTRQEYDAAEEEGVGFSSAFASDATLEEVLLHRIRDIPEARTFFLIQTMAWVILTGSILATAIWFASSVLRRYPARVLLLRKFNDRDLATSMERVIAGELRPFGHIITLSDKHIRRSRWEWIRDLIPVNFLHAAILVVWLPLRMILRLFNRTRFGAARVGSSRDFRHLAHHLRDRASLNLEVCFTSGQEVFTVRSTDAWWQQVVALLMDSADVIVADLSHVTSGTRWELEQLEALGYFDRAVLLAREDREQDARNAMSGYPKAGNRPLFLYRKDGDTTAREDFRREMLHVIAGTIQVRNRPNR